MKFERKRCCRAVTVLEKLRGYSQPSVVLTTGATLYVVKFQDFTGRFGLMSEAIGAQLMAAMGLPSPPWCAIQFTDSFLNLHPELWHRTKAEAEGIRPRAGLHFGSRMVLSEGKNPTYEVLPSSWTRRVANLDQFVGVLLLDLWTNNCDRRQSIFLYDEETSGFRAVFIDNDHMFGGFCGNEKTCPRRLMTTTSEFYRSCWRAESVSRWKRVIDSITERQLDSIMDGIPREWADRSALEHARSELRSRRARLNGLIADVDQALASFVSNPIRVPMVAAVPREG